VGKSGEHRNTGSQQSPPRMALLKLLGARLSRPASWAVKA
jgi:hypothetical protein